MAATTEHALILSGLRTGDTPATWGQQAIWHRMHTAGQETHTFNISRTVPVPPALPVSAVLHALGQLVERYESLRTRHVGDEAADLRQRLQATESLVVQVRETGDEDLTTLLPALSERLLEIPFDPTIDVGLRALVVTRYGAAHTVLISLSHQAVDRSSANIVVDTLAALLTAGVRGRNAPKLAPARQPLEQAAYESSAEGARASANALRNWLTQLEAVPTTTFSVTYPPREARFWTGTLHSTAVAMATNVLAVRYRTNTSVVLLAALGVTMGQVTGSPVQPVLLMSGNRFAAELRYAVGNLAQPVLTTIDRADPSFAGVVRQVWSATARAYRNGQYDPIRLGQLEREVNLRRGPQPDLHCYFNDRRTTTRPDRSRAVSADTLRAACANTAFRWLEPLSSERIRYFVNITATDDAILLSMLADTRVLPPEHIHAVLHDMERLLVTEATGP